MFDCIARFLFILVSPSIPCVSGASLFNYAHFELVEKREHHIRVEEENIPLSEKEALTKAASHYVEILNKIGSDKSKYPSEEIMPLCTKNCRKIRNGKLLFEGRELFTAQLDIGKEWLGSWSIDVQEVLISTDNRTATIRYELATEKEGDLVVIVILHFDSNYMISEINEVHNRLEK